MQNQQRKGGGSDGKSKSILHRFSCKVRGGASDEASAPDEKAGISEIDMENKFVAIKMHFGELGNLRFPASELCESGGGCCEKNFGGKPFLTDCNTLYPGSRKNALEHLYCAWENGVYPDDGCMSDPDRRRS